MSASAVFLVKTLFDLYIGALLLRFLLQLVRADFRNPFSQFLVKATNPVVIPLRRIIPGMGGMDMASLLMALMLQAVKMLLLAVIAGRLPSIAGLLILSLADLTELLLTLYTATLILQVILSWVAQGTYNPLANVLHSLNEPLLSPVRRLIPAISGFDLSPIGVLIVFQLLRILLVAPLTDFGRGLG
ncbi:MAG: YggT family protein [Gammaproteobacteria bacterium]|nr:YggT family protein [Gammaproteobacteria bacterium]